jgi:hypothetical protein
MFKLNLFLDTLISNFIDYRTKTYIFTIPPRGEGPPNLANLAGILGSFCKALFGDSKRRAYFEERFKHLGRTSLFAT